MTARVSVIISTYNRKDTLKKAILSVLDQSMQDFEIIVVDDCSTVDVEKLVRDIGDPRITYIRTPENSGHDGRPKNLGIKAAKGEYICFLDDDDTYRRDALQILLTYAAQSGNDVVYGDYLIDGKAGWSVDFSVTRLTQHNYISMCVAMVKRDALVKVGGFDEEVPKFKDWNLWLRMQKAGCSFLHVPIIVLEVDADKADSISAKFDIDRDPTTGQYLPTFFNPADCLIYPKVTSLGARKPLKVAVYSLTMNRLEYTKQMLKALELTAGYDFDLFIIDQGSKDGTLEWIKSLKRDDRRFPGAEEGTYCGGKLLYRAYENNVGLAKGWNNIVQFVKTSGEYDIIIKVDNDAELMTKNWLLAMVGIFERNRKVILSPYVEGLEGSPGGVLRQRASGDSPYLVINDRVLGLVPNLGGIVFATPIEIWNKWEFDEAYQGNKDLIFSKYARGKGFALFYMEEFRVWHIDGTKGQHSKYPEYFKGRADFKDPEEDKPVASEGTN